MATGGNFSIVHESMCLILYEKVCAKVNILSSRDMLSERRIARDAVAASVKYSGY